MFTCGSLSTSTHLATKEKVQNGSSVAVSAACRGGWAGAGGGFGQTLAALVLPKTREGNFTLLWYTGGNFCSRKSMCQLQSRSKILSWLTNPLEMGPTLILLLAVTGSSRLLLLNVAPGRFSGVQSKNNAMHKGQELKVAQKYSTCSYCISK